MSNDRIAAKDKIIQAALDVIGRQGTENITTRAIAQKAGVNHAAINYYFESKADLIGRTLGYFQAGIQTVFRRLEQSGPTPEERLFDFAMEFIRYNGRYPGVEHQILSRLMTASGTDDILCAVMDKNLSALEAVILELTGAPYGEAVSFKAVAFFSGLTYPLLLSRYGAAVMGAEYADNGTTRAYIRHLIDMLTV